MKFRQLAALVRDAARIEIRHAADRAMAWALPPSTPAPSTEAETPPPAEAPAVTATSEVEGCWDCGGTAPEGLVVCETCKEKTFARWDAERRAAPVEMKPQKKLRQTRVKKVAVPSNGTGKEW